MIKKMKNRTRLPGWGSAQLAVLLQYADSQTYARESLLEGSEIDERTLCDYDPSLNQELIVISNLIDISPLHPFKLGLEVGRTNNSNSFGLLGQALTACRSVRDIISIVSEYLSGEHHFNKIKTKLLINKITTTFEAPASLPDDLCQFLIGRDFGSAIAFQESVLKGISPMTAEVGFIGEELPGMQDIANHYDCEIKFHQEHNYILTHIKALDVLLPFGNKVLSKLLSDKIYRYFNPVHSRNVSLTSKIKQILEDENYHPITKEEASKRLNMSSRTLARHLEKSGTTWREYCTQLRMERAKYLLLESNNTLDAISHSVGFSSSSAFSSAFSREVGKSPLEFRETNKLQFHTQTLA